LVAHLIEPALVDTGEHWYRRTAHVFQENLASGYLRHKLIGLVEAARARNTQPRGRILLCSIQGDRHEGGILILSFHLEVAGWRAIDLGSDLPTGELVRAVKAWSPEGVCVSFILSRNINKRFDELGQIQDVPVFVGGRSILNYQRLARNHGLVPISGQAKAAVAMVVDRLDAVSRNHHRSSPAASVLVSDA
jgi:methanogenic corrinoid protein MtbC1